MDPVIPIVGFAAVALGFAAGCVYLAIQGGKSESVIATLSLDLGRSLDRAKILLSETEALKSQIRARDQLITDHQSELEQLQDMLAEVAPDGLAARLFRELFVVPDEVPEAAEGGADRGDPQGGVHQPGDDAA